MCTFTMIKHRSNTGGTSSNNISISFYPLVNNSLEGSTQRSPFLRRGYSYFVNENSKATTPAIMCVWSLTISCDHINKDI